MKRGDGIVNCFICDKPITKEEYATLEHILPVSLGGTDDMCNLALSHQKCNHTRGNKIIVVDEDIEDKSGEAHE